MADAPEKERPFINKILTGDVVTQLRLLPDEFVQMVVTSPPYWGLRKYAGEQEGVWGGDAKCEHEWGAEVIRPCGNAPSSKSTLTTNAGKGPLPGDKYHHSQKNEASQGAFCQKCGAWRGAYGWEPTHEMYVEHTVLILREIRRVLRKDGVCFWNIGDCYAGSGGPGGDFKPGAGKDGADTYGRQYHREGSGLKHKDIVMIPFRVALAVQADGWWVRSDIVWAKPNPMPESCTDRPTKSHEYIFLFTKSADYFWDQEAIRERWADERMGRAGGNPANRKRSILGADSVTIVEAPPHSGRNPRDVWTIATESFSGSHFATFPQELVRRCVKAGSSEKGRCPTCGGAWERVVEKGEPDEEHKRACGADSKGEYHGESEKFLKQDALGKPTYTGFNARWKASQQNASDVKRRILEGMRERKSSWVQSCDCPAHEPIPCIVLDPFMGSGTTALVALNNNRKFIGIEINPGYVEMAYKRIDTPLKLRKLEDFL